LWTCLTRKRSGRSPAITTNASTAAATRTGLRGEEIPFLARILALADAFSAITLDRPYRRGLARHEAYAELQRVVGTQLDPELVKSFGRVVVALEDEPVATAVPF